MNMIFGFLLFAVEAGSDAGAYSPVSAATVTAMILTIARDLIALLKKQSIFLADIVAP
jgi:hypothetical protein